MNLSLPALRSCALLFVALMPIANVTTAKEPSTVTARKAVVLALPSKISNNKPWPISLTIQESQPTAKPIAGLSPSKEGTGWLLASSARPALFPADSHPSSLSPHLAANLSLPTLVAHQDFSRQDFSRQGFIGNTPALGLFDLLSNQPLVAGDASGDGTIDFVDISSAIQLEHSPSNYRGFSSMGIEKHE